MPPDTRRTTPNDSRPDFIDNRGGNTLARAIGAHLQALASEGSVAWGLDVASAFFNVPGFRLIANDLDRLPRVRLLLGADPKPEAERPDRAPGDPDEPEWTTRQVEESLRKQEAGLAHSRDLLPFDEGTDATIRRLLDYLHSGKIEVRRYPRHFLHAKAYLFRLAGGGAVVGSSNLTYAGLSRNIELNIGAYEDRVVGRIEGWFDELWDLAEPFDLAAYYDRLMAEFPPHLIFLRTLFELYGDELEQEQREAGNIPITQFQQHGVWRALRIMKDCGGVLIADGVGLGKTFTAGEIIRLYRENRQRVLLICPAALRDSAWKDFLYKHDLVVDCVSFEQLARERQLGGDTNHLRSPIEDYALVVIDEAHNYRNPDSPMRAGVLRRLLMGPRRGVVMLSATPVNNSLWDLYHLLRYFLKQDAHLADRGVLSIRERFEDAMDEDPFNLNPDLLYPVIDATTVKRTRKFVKKHYSNDLIKSSDGSMKPIQFPRPVASSIVYDLEESMPGFLDELEDALAPPAGSPKLSMARYQPDVYRLGATEEERRRDAAIVGLIRSGILKRFESSVFAFAETTRRMVEEHDFFLDMLDRGWVVRRELLHEVSLADDDDAIEEIIKASGHKESAAEFDVKSLARDARADRDLLDSMCRRAQHVKPESDPKLEALVEQLDAIAKQAKEEAVDEEDERNKAKTLIFSFYKDSVDWIEGFLSGSIERDPRLKRYRGRLASIAGDENRGGISRDDAVFGFAPESTGAPPKRQDDRFDVLVSTDVLAEGMNLQQCRNIINFDLPWNPMRLVQRHGRVDRILSDHREVYLRTFFPDQQLDRLLNLEARVRTKLARAAASIGVETTPIPHGAEGQQSFAETRDEIERLAKNDSTIYEMGGTESAAQSGEEYRQELRKSLERDRDRVVNLPWKAGSGMVKGARRGHFFCARAGERTYLRFVPFEPEADIVGELGACLRLIECAEETPRVVPTDLKQTAYGAWERARRDILDAWAVETDPKNLQPKVPKINRELATFLRERPPVGVEQERLDRGLDALEAPCSRREENLLRTVFATTQANDHDRAIAIIEEVERIGLEPFHPPDPLPPIDPEQVHLICWLAIERAEAD